MLKIKGLKVKIIYNNDLRHQLYFFTNQKAVTCVVWCAL